MASIIRRSQIFKKITEKNCLDGTYSKLGFYKSKARSFRCKKKGHFKRECTNKEVGDSNANRLEEISTGKLFTIKFLLTSLMMLERNQWRLKHQLQKHMLLKLIMNSTGITMFNKQMLLKCLKKMLMKHWIR